jgi:hypothetical protein
LRAGENPQWVTDGRKDAPESRAAGRVSSVFSAGKRSSAVVSISDVDS